MLQYHPTFWANRQQRCSIGVEPHPPRGGGVTASRYRPRSLVLARVPVPMRFLFRRDIAERRMGHSIGPTKTYVPCIVH